MAGERVVVLENDQELLEMNRDVFEWEGFKVTSIHLGKVTNEEILARLAEMEERPDLVLTEVGRVDEHWDFTDEAGLAIAGELVKAGQRVVIYSEDYHYKKEAERRELPFIWKAEGPLAASAKVKEMFGASR